MRIELALHLAYRFNLGGNEFERQEMRLPLPQAAGNRGILVVSAASTSQITGPGLRVSSTGSFSAIPKQAAPGQ